MSFTPSAPLPLGTRAPRFLLPDTSGLEIALDDFRDAPALLVVFLCNHCPYVKHVQQGLASLAQELEARGVAVLGINANDVSRYPEDSPELMAREAAAAGYTFPYLFDESQLVARAFGAACTPECFLFDGERRLVYRGQLDDSRPGNSLPVTGADVRAAVDAVLEGHPVPWQQKPSFGCNIKWRAGNEPEYFAF